MQQVINKIFAWIDYQGGFIKHSSTLYCLFLKFMTAQIKKAKLNPSNYIVTLLGLARNDHFCVENIFIVLFYMLGIIKQCKKLTHYLIIVNNDYNM